MTPAKPQNLKPAGATAPKSDQPASIRVVAALHERDGAVLVAVGEMPEPGRPFRLADTRRFSSAEHQALRSYLKEAAVDLVLRVAPAGQSLARTTTLPDNIPDGTSLAEAMALIAESELPAQLPWYRRTGGRIRVRSASNGGSGGNGLSAGLLVGWHRPDQAFPNPLADVLDGLRQLWTTESVALAALLPSVQPDAASPARWIAALDQTSGVLALTAAGGDKSSARVLRLPADEPRRLPAAAASIQESLAAVTAAEQPAPQLSSDRYIQTSDHSDRLMIAGQLRDAAWIDQFAIPAALVETFADADSAVRSLFNLHATEPRQRLGLLQGVLTWLSSPTRAAAVIAACLAALLLVPLGVAYARHSTLRERMAAVTGLDERLAAAEQRVAFYALLRERRWPMTKLMADIATSTPEGITLEVLELTQGESITVRGTAKSNDLVTRFRENLAKTRVFDAIATPNVGSSAEGVQFQLQARVSPTGAIYRGNLIDDFAKNPLGKRLYGDEFDPAADFSASPAASDSPASSSSTPSSRPYPGRPAPPREPGSSGSSGNATAAQPVLPALSDEAIAKMERGPVVIEWAKRKGAANRVEDAAVKARLLSEVEKLNARKEELDRQGAKK